jgi:putative hydrolase of the HAD superfamily
VPELHLFTDADNTLWDTDSIYAGAQLGLLRDLETLTGRLAAPTEDGGLAQIRSIDQGIAARHTDGLRYPSKMLVRAVISWLQGTPGDDAVSEALASGGVLESGNEVMHARFLKRLGSQPSLRSGVRRGLVAAMDSEVPVTVVTEGRESRCVELLALHELDRYVGRVISTVKTRAAYEELKRGTTASSCMMIGDQIDRDIQPAAQAGFETFLFPSRFAPHWNDGVRQTADHIVNEYDAIVPFMDRSRSVMRRPRGVTV